MRRKDLGPSVLLVALHLVGLAFVAERGAAREPVRALAAALVAPPVGDVGAVVAQLRAGSSTRACPLASRAVEDARPIASSLER